MSDFFDGLTLLFPIESLVYIYKIDFQGMEMLCPNGQHLKVVLLMYLLKRIALNGIT